MQLKTIQSLYNQSYLGLNPYKKMKSKFFVQAGQGYSFSPILVVVLMDTTSMYSRKEEADYSKKLRILSDFGR